MRVVFGLVGAVLAAQGRSAEQRSGLADGALWRAVALVLASLGAVLGLWLVFAIAVVFALTAPGSVREQLEQQPPPKPASHPEEPPSGSVENESVRETGPETKDS